MAEIDRRSKIIFQKRKQQKKRMLIACVPAVLCVALCFTFIRISMNSAENNAIEQKNINNTIATHSNNDTVEPSKFGIRLMSVEVYGSGIEITNYQADVLVSVEHIFNNITSKADADNNTINQFGDSSSVSNSNKEDDIRFVLTSTDGQIKEYLLTECDLIDLNTKIKYHVDETDILILLQILEISPKN